MYYDGTPDPVAVPTVGTWTYKGCFQFVVHSAILHSGTHPTLRDSAAKRTLLERIDGPDPITPAQCTASCKAAGYQFSGFEFSVECCTQFLVIALTKKN